MKRPCMGDSSYLPWLGKTALREAQLLWGEAFSSVVSSFFQPFLGLLRLKEGGVGFINDFPSLFRTA